MKAVGFWTKGLPSCDERSLEDLQLADPAHPKGRDLLVRVQAVSVNPRDVKSRMSMDPSNGAPVVLGYDASGVVEAVGPEASLFKPGDEVYYAGVLNRQGANAELQWVDERIVGRKPTTLDHATAAALPLTSLTAWEMLFDRLSLPPGGGAGESLLVIGGAGGVPTMAIQIARQLTHVTVIATASRPESEAWVRTMGAHQVINHFHPLPAQLEAIEALTPVTRIFSTHTMPKNWAEMAQVIAPQGRLGLIDDPEPLDLRLMKFKSVSIHWEAMFTRPMHATADMQRQHDILNTVADLIDNNTLVAPHVTSYGTINAANLRRAHAALEEGHTVGKITLAGF